MSELVTLNKIRPGESAVVKSLLTGGNMRRRFMDIGLVEETELECVGQSPAGDPGAYMIRGAVIAIRSEDAATVLVKAQGKAAV